MQNLKSTKFHKIMADASIVESGRQAVLTKKKLDLIFAAVNKNKCNMNFDNFLITLTKVAETKYLNYDEGIDPFQAMNLLIYNHMLPLSQKITNDNRFMQGQLQQISYDDLTQSLIRDVGLVLFSIY